MIKQEEFAIIHPAYGLNHLWIYPGLTQCSDSSQRLLWNPPWLITQQSLQPLQFLAQSLHFILLSPPTSPLIRFHLFCFFSQHQTFSHLTHTVSAVPFLLCLLCHQFQPWCQVLALSITIPYPFFSLSRILFHQSSPNTPVHPVSAIVNTISHMPLAHPQRTQPLPPEH